MKLYLPRSPLRATRQRRTVRQTVPQRVANRAGGRGRGAGAPRHRRHAARSSATRYPGGGAARADCWPTHPAGRPVVHRRRHAGHERPRACRRGARRAARLKVLFTTGYTRNAIVHAGVLDPGVRSSPSRSPSSSWPRRCRSCCRGRAIASRHGAVKRNRRRSNSLRGLGGPRGGSRARRAARADRPPVPSRRRSPSRRACDRVGEPDGGRRRSRRWPVRSTQAERPRARPCRRRLGRAAPTARSRAACGS